MGDLSEMRGLITTVSFIGCLVILIAYIPPQFYTTDQTWRASPPEYFEAIDIEQYSETWNHTMDGTDCVDYVDWWVFKLELGGHPLQFWYAKANKTPSWGDTRFKHYWYWWIFPTAMHDMKWYNKKGLYLGETLEKTELDNDYESGNIRYSVKCDHFQMSAFFGFNETVYSKPSQAWDSNELRIMLGIKFDQVNTAINAWNLVGMLLIFQLPDVHWVVNVLLSLPFWVCIAYLIFVLILKAIPFVGD